MQGVRATPGGSVSFLGVLILLILATIPVPVFAGDAVTVVGPSLAALAVRMDTWGDRAPGEPIRVVWLVPESVATGDAWLWIGDRRIAAPGERLELPGLDRVARVWTVPQTALDSRASGDPGGRKLGFGTDPDVPPAERNFLQLGEGPAGGSGAAVFCIDCEGIAPLEIEHALASRASAQRDRLHPAATDILVLAGSRIYPNPFNPFLEDAEVEFTLSEAAEVEVTAYDWNGDYVDTVYRGSGVAGTQTVRWAGQTEDGRKLGNGVYLLRVVAQVGSRQESEVVKAVVWNEN